MPVGQVKPKECPSCSGLLTSSATDASAYAWFEWGPNALGQWTILDVDGGGGSSLDVYLAPGFGVRVPSAYPDGSTVLEEERKELVTRAVRELGFDGRIASRLAAGVPASSLRRVLGHRIESRVVALMQEGRVTPPVDPTTAKKKPSKKARRSA